MMFTAEAPDLANAYCILQAVDILNMLPSTANPADPLSNVTARVRMCVLLHVFTFVEHIIAIAKDISSGSIV
jgi:hypothetical protein